MSLIRTISQLAVGATLLSGCTSFAGAQNIQNFGKCPVEYGFQGSFHFPKDIKSRVTVERFNEISPTVRNLITTALKKRVGTQFLKKLRLDYGNAVDFDLGTDLKLADVNRIDIYDLVFRFSDKARGLTAFRFKVVADSNGRLVDDLALPDIASDPQKANLISCGEAKQVAKRNGFPLNRSSIYIVYDWDIGSLTWIIYDKKEVQPDNHSFVTGPTHRNIAIDAHTGRVLKIYKETIVF